MGKRIGIICIVIGVLLILSSAGLVIYNRSLDSQAAKQAEMLLPEIKSAIEKELIQSVIIPEENAPEAEPGEMKTAEVNGNGYIGYLTIPELNLELPVMAEWDYKKLKISPCRYYGSTKTDNLVIAAHNYPSHFGRLSQLEIGDDVLFTDVNGRIKRFKVALKETLSADATKEMIAGEWELSLYTCTYGGANRVTIKCAEQK